MAPEETHAKYSPSSLELLELCPCYTQDNTRDTKASDDGTRLHKAVETCDLSLCEDEDEEDAVTRCLVYLDKLVEHYKGECTVEKELRIIVEDITTGTGDIVLIAGKIGELIDWKFGRMPVTDAEDNVQMQNYVLGIFHMFPELDKVTVHIVAPRMDSLSTATYKRSDMDRIRKRTLQIVASCEAEDKQATAAEKACRWCGGKASCPRINEAALTVAKSIGLPMPIEFAPGRLLAPEDRAKAQVLSYILEDWASQVRTFNKNAVLEDGIEIPGFDIRSRKGNTSVVDVYSATQTAIEHYEGLSVDSVLQACSLSLTKLVDQVYALVQTQGKKETKKAIRENINILLKDYCTEANTVSFLQRKKGKTNEDIIKECK